jgi:hypothetical protein
LPPDPSGVVLDDVGLHVRGERAGDGLPWNAIASSGTVMFSARSWLETMTQTTRPTTISAMPPRMPRMPAP